MIAAGWLLAASAEGLTALGPAAELRVELDRPATDPQGLLREISDAARPEELAALTGLSTGAAGDLLSALREAGAIAEHAARPEIGHSLRSALTGIAAEHGAHEVIWTAEELLLLPTDLPEDVRGKVLRAFIAGSDPFARLNAYAQLISGSGSVAGDRPVSTDLSAAIAEAQPEDDEIAVISLTDAAKCATLSAAQFARLDAGGAHRLGPITRVHRPENFAPEGLPELHYTVAEIAEPLLDRPTPAIDRRVQGSGTLEHSELTARAEGAERFALALHNGGELLRGRFSEIDGAVDPASIFAYNARQITRVGHDPARHDERLWCAAETSAGERRWVPAELAGVSVPNPLPLTSSGVAAHTDPALTRNAALAELVERDAFMWTWIQRISRERIDPAGIPAEVAEWAEALARSGWTAHWINVTMELQPAVLCCLVDRSGGLVVGAASRPEPAAALRKATLEALVLALRFDPSAHQPAPIEQTRSPVDHLVLHMDPAGAADREFLYASAELIELGDLVGGQPLDEALAAIDVEPVYIDLSVPCARPFHVTRAVAAGLVPLTFGWDSEPLGLERLAQPRRRHDGTRIGEVLDLGTAPARDPHPFA